MSSISISSWDLRRELYKLLPPDKVELFLAFLKGSEDAKEEVLAEMSRFEERIGVSFPRDRSLRLSDVIMLAWLIGIRPSDPVGQKTLPEILALQGVTLEQFSAEAREARVKMKILERDRQWVETAWE